MTDAERPPVSGKLEVKSGCPRTKFAAVSKIVDERVVLTVCSPTGRTYRLRRDMDAQLFMEGTIPILAGDEPDDWRDNFGDYDVRW